MNLLIKGIEMPKNCCECPINIYLCNYGYKYLIQHRELYDKRADDCPLIEVPSHGRLIDADALLNLLNHCMFPSDMVTTTAVRMATNWIKDAPTIIETEVNE